MSVISVIIPVYNGQETILETVQSALNQSYPDLEVLIINDGSQDQTLERLRVIVDSRLQVFSYPNAGPSTSRNRGIALARGKYIAFLDADDLWTQNKLETQFQALQNNSEAAVAYSWTDYIDEKGNFLQRGRHLHLEGNVYAELLVNNFIENGSNVLIRRQALQEIGGFEPSLSIAEDWDLWLRLARHYHFAVVPEAQVLYRVHGASSTVNLTRLETQSLQFLDRVFVDVPTAYQHLKKRSLANLYKYLTWKALDVASLSEPSWTSLRLTLNYIKHEPELFKEAKFAAIMLVKSAIAGLLPTQQARTLLARLKKS